MLRKFGRPSRVGPQNYLRVEHPGWAIAVAARAAVEKGLPELGEREPGTAGAAGTTRRGAPASVRNVRDHGTF
jgi:hypothetical protein